jgi:hypothetical protein
VQLLQLGESAGNKPAAAETRIDAKLPKVSKAALMSINEKATDGTAREVWVCA